LSLREDPTEKVYLRASCLSLNNSIQLDPHARKIRLITSNARVSERDEITRQGERPARRWHSILSNPIRLSSVVKGRRRFNRSITQRAFRVDHPLRTPRRDARIGFIPSSSSRKVQSTKPSKYRPYGSHARVSCFVVRSLSLNQLSGSLPRKLKMWTLLRDNATHANDKIMKSHASLLN